MSTCEHCVHYKTERHDKAYGECRRYPPAPGRMRGGMYQPLWPAVYADNYCGEYRAVVAPEWERRK